MCLHPPDEAFAEAEIRSELIRVAIVRNDHLPSSPLPPMLVLQHKVQFLGGETAAGRLPSLYCYLLPASTATTIPLSPSRSVTPDPEGMYHSSRLMVPQIQRSLHYPDSAQNESYGDDRYSTGFLIFTNTSADIH